MIFLAFLNGNLYGRGDAEYMSELFRNYVVAHGLYGRASMEFRIERIETEESE